MTLEDYKQTYFNFTMAVDQTRLIALTAGETLKDFPKNLPPDSKEAMATTFSELGEKLIKAANSVRESQNREESSPNQTEHSKVPFLTPIAEPAIYLITTQVLSGKEALKFDSLLYAQELVMLLAHLEAFMSDSLRVMCKVERRILHKNKKMTWDNILQANDYDKLIEMMIEEYTYDFGWKSIREKVSFLELEHGLSINVPSDDLEMIDEAEKLRHIIVHNGSRVSQEYLNRTGKTDVNVGEIIPIDQEYTGTISSKVRILGSDIFRAIAVKFFHVEQKDLHGVWRRGRPESLSE